MKRPLHTELILTEDGSHSLFVPLLDEHYHSTHGAIQESRHVFINAAFEASKAQKVNILEVGFGTGLNSFLTLLSAEKTNRKIHYTGLELFPLAVESAKQLNYPQLIDIKKESFYLALHEAPWNETVKIKSDFTLNKLNIDFSNPDNFSSNSLFDIIYFDAFAPEKQSEMWTQQIFDKLFTLCNSNAILTTYCAKGAVRRMLQSAGFTVERLPGPPGKREMLRAQKL